MSTLPPDRPTERIPPIRPAVRVEERIVAPPAIDPNVVLLRIEDAIASLRTWLVIVGVIAVAGLGVAIYALSNDGATVSRDGLASNARVDRISREVQALRAGGGSDTTALSQRIDRLSRQVQTLRARVSSSADTGALSGRVATLERTVKTLSSSSTGDSAAAVQQLSDRVDTLARDVEQLKQSQTP